MTSTILVVDDDREINRAIAKLLTLEGFQTITAFDGLEAIAKLNAHNVALIILDVMMPKLDGLSSMMKIRESRNIPIIVLSCKSEDTDKILALSMGADDYVTKPYNPAELVARVKSQIRRYTVLGDIENHCQGSNIINIGALSLNLTSRQLSLDGEVVRLTATEYKIMELLMTNAGIIFPAEKIYERVWGVDAYSVENTVMVHIRRIREKIEVNTKDPKYLKVVWGIGYKIEKMQ